MELQERSLSMDGNHTERGAAQLGCIALAFSTDPQDPLRHDFIEYSLERATAELENSSFATNSHFLKARRNVIDNLLSLVRTNVKWLTKCGSRMLGFPKGRY